MMPKKVDSLRSQGVTSMATDSPTKAKLKAQALASGMTLAEYLRVLADKASSGQQGQMITVTNPIASVEKRVSSIESSMKGIGLLFKAIAQNGHLSDEDIKALESTPLGLFTDRQIVSTFKEAGKAIGKKLPGFNGEVKKERDTA